MSGIALPAALVERLRVIRTCGAITGAGVSQESGIHTYRGAGGSYEDSAAGNRTVNALSVRTLSDDPDHCWHAVSRLCREAEAARPNAAHEALVAIEQRMDRFVLLTQSIDGLHHRAGSRHVIEVHGNVFGARCGECRSTGKIDSALLNAIRHAPRCGICSEILRPDIVLSGELVPMQRVEPLLSEFYLHPPELLIIAGTSAVLPYITEPVLFARQAGRLTVEVNTESTHLSEYVDFRLRGSAATVLPQIAAALSSADAERPAEARGRRDGPRRDPAVDRPGTDS